MQRVKINPDTAALLRRFEDAEVSRESLLRAQRGRAGLTTELSSIQKKRLKKRLKSKSKKDKKQKEVSEKEKTPLEVEIEVEEKRKALEREERKLLQQERFLQLEDFKQQREFRANQDRIRADLLLGQQRELQRQTDFISGQNRILADQQIAQAERTQRGQLAGRERAQQQRQFEDRQDLENRRLQIQRDEIDANFETNREQRALRYAELDAERARYDRDVRRAEIQRDVDISRQERELRGVQERVARDDAFRHRQLEEQNKLVLEGLARLGRDNSLAHERELARIESQRAVDAERAITDREKEQTLQAGLDLLRHNQNPEQVGVGELREIYDESGLPPAHVDVQGGAKSPKRSPRQPESVLSIDSESTDLSTQESKQHPSRRKRAVERAPIREEEVETTGLRTPSPRAPSPKTGPSRRVNIEEATSSGRTVKKPAKFEGGATEEELAAAGGVPGQTPKSEVSVEFRAEELTKSQVARDLPFEGPKPELNLQQPEAIKDEPTDRPAFQEIPPAIKGEIGETESEIAQAEADIELFGKQPEI